MLQNQLTFTRSEFNGYARVLGDLLASVHSLASVPPANKWSTVQGDPPNAAIAYMEPLAAVHHGGVQQVNLLDILTVSPCRRWRRVEPDVRPGETCCGTVMLDSERRRKELRRMGPKLEW